MGQEREAAFRIRKAAKRLLFEAAEEYLREHGAEAMFKMKSQSQQVPLFCGRLSECIQGKQPACYFVSRMLEAPKHATMRA